MSIVIKSLFSHLDTLPGGNPETAEEVMMQQAETIDWKQELVTVTDVLAKIKPGMNIFVGTGIAEPRTLVQGLMASQQGNLQDLTLIQVVSLGDTINKEVLDSRKFRLKTFYSGWVANEAITSGQVDLIPSRFSRLPWLVESGFFQIDVAFVQISTPDEAGYASLGVAVDIARQAMQQASIVVGEICDQVPVTLGDTFVHIRDFNYLVQSTEKPWQIGRWAPPAVFDRVAENVARIVEDGSCISFSIGPLYESLAKKLQSKRHLGIHSVFVTDAVMDLIKSGAVSNRCKNFFRGKSIGAYAIGTPQFMAWLHRNPLVELQGVDVVLAPQNIGKNERFMAIFPASRVDITGDVALHAGKGMVAVGPGELLEHVEGARISPGGRVICALPSRNREGHPTIQISVQGLPNKISMRESLDMIVTEYGVAALTGLSVRERAQAIIDIAHPDDREELIFQAKQKQILYQDQIYLAESGHLFPHEIQTKQTFKNGLIVNFRPIKPSDEEAMRTLFYRFSDESVYYRYFSAIKTMPHAKMQEYVNVDFSKDMAIIGYSVSATGKHRLVCEGRYVHSPHHPYADTAFVVDEQFQNHGIATFLLDYLIQIAKQHGLKGLMADVLATNKSMMKVFEKSQYPITAVLASGIYELTIQFDTSPGDHPGITYMRSQMPSWGS
ncbi:GNAT family N-acetyltransferase [candidate division CSSED10-310 bacterium]|uniref:GNAT family N-acetyltransferase n=1 Tax=candidate division CSSED10-310 bacterium TaxID=2855610 RepID=A0ABV6Z0T0_UNCC1